MATQEKKNNTAKHQTAKQRKEILLQYIKTNYRRKKKTLRLKQDNIFYLLLVISKETNVIFGMKLSTVISIATVTSLVAAKNVINLQNLRLGVEAEEETHKNDKRDPKNVVNLQGLRLGVINEEEKEVKHAKRDAKNVVDFIGLRQADGESKHINKREPKNVVNLAHFDEDDEDEGKKKREAKRVTKLHGDDILSKRDPKNIVNLQALKEGFEAEAKAAGNVKRTFNADLPQLKILKDSLDEGNEPKRDAQDLARLASLVDVVGKRDAKNVVNLNDFITSSKPVKREPKNVFNLDKFQQSNHQVKRQEEQQQVLDNSNNVFTFDLADCYNNLLQSVLPQLSSISIFSGYIRQFQDIDAKTANPNEVMLIVAPNDDAVESKLNDLKPWEFPKSLESNMNEKEQEDVVNDNLLNFLNGHLVNNFEKKLIIDKSVSDSVIIVTQLNNGNFLKIKQIRSTDKFFIKLVEQENWINVESVKQVENGFVFIINDSLVKP